MPDSCCTCHYCPAADIASRPPGRLAFSSGLGFFNSSPSTQRARLRLTLRLGLPTSPVRIRTLTRASGRSPRRLCSWANVKLTLMSSLRDGRRHSRRFQVGAQHRLQDAAQLRHVTPALEDPQRPVRTSWSGPPRTYDALRTVVHQRQFPSHRAAHRPGRRVSRWRACR